MSGLAPLLAAWLIMFTVIFGIWIGWTLCSFFGGVLPWIHEDCDDESGEKDDA